ncbi:MAG: Uma2 family endonuclease [Microcoleus sp.]
MMTQTQTSRPLAINIPPALTLTVSHEQFVELAIANRELQLERTSTGELIVNPPTGGETGKRNFNIALQLGMWNQQAKLGEAFDSSTGFHLPNGADRSPDASWVRQDRWDALTPKQKDSFIPLCPDFVVELRSKSDNMEPLRVKMREYMNNGARLGWLIDRKNRKVEIYRQNREVEVLENPATLSGEEVLPGFVLDLTQIW